MLFKAKTLEEALEKASKETGTAVDQVNYTVKEESKGLFSKSIEIEVFTLPEIIEFAKAYVTKVIENYEMEITVETKIEDGVIHMSLDTSHNSVIIGKNGRTLQALNDATRAAIAGKFKKFYRILIDINNYKDARYDKLIKMAKRLAKDVQRSRIPLHLDPMPADERRIIHNALTNFSNIKTESEGSGATRHLVISYIDSN